MAEPKRLTDETLATLLRTSDQGLRFHERVALRSHIAALEAGIVALKADLAKPVLMRVTDTKKRPDLMIADCRRGRRIRGDDELAGV